MVCLVMRTKIVTKTIYESATKILFFGVEILVLMEGAEIESSKKVLRNYFNL